MTARRIALQILLRWDPRQSYASDLLGQSGQTLTSRDRGLLQELVLGVVRHVRLLDYWISQLSKTNRGKRQLDPDVQQILRLGIYQVRFTRIPAHAAVSEMVHITPARGRAFVNAILRRVTREPETLDQWQKQAPPAIRWSISDFLWQRWSERMPEDELNALLLSIQQVPVIHLHPNPFHPTHPATLHAPAEPLPQWPGYFTCQANTREALMWLRDGVAYAQDAAASIAVDMLAPKAGERILDACAAPGGKTWLLAVRSQGKAEITAADSSENRIQRLSENLRRLHVPNTQTLLCDWLKRDLPFPDPFDAVLIDAPCSNTGVLRRRPEARLRFTPESLDQHVTLQQGLLDKLANAVRPGGRLVYSTCSLEPEENRDGLRHFLKHHPEFELEDSRQTWPHKDQVDGHFAARLRKQPTS